MPKKKSLFITFEGIEGSGKTYQSKKLFKSLKNKKLPVVFTREPGGNKSAEKIRKIILTGNKDKFRKKTDTLLYLAARNEHFENTLKPYIKNKKIIICDRFIDSTIAYQVYGHNVNKSLVDKAHKEILGALRPDLTFILYVNINKSLSRVKKRKSKNRYDKFSRKFYNNVQNAFVKIGKKNTKRYCIIDNSNDTNIVEKVILNKVLKVLKK